jgi:ubiquinone/menaquinone biosynthesis C-methylase UbiE
MYTRIIQWAFQRFYREFAWTYDRVAAIVSWGRWRRWTLAALSALHGDILELGCGTGNLQQAVGEMPIQRLGSIFAIDASPQMLRLTRQKAPHAQLANADASALPFIATAFDTVIATFPSEYIMAATTLKEIRRVLRPNGQLLIILGAQLAGPHWYRQLVALAYRVLLLAPPATQQPSGSATALLQAIEQAGMQASDAWVAAAGGWVYLVTAKNQEPRTNERH